jgi:Tfp pilus assembly protein PilO
MKLTKMTWIVLIVAVLVIAASSLGWMYSQQVEKQQQINTQLNSAKIRLAAINLDDLNKQKDDFTKQIEQLNAQLKTNKAKLATLEDSIDATNAILEDAKSHSVEILEMSSPGEGKEELSGVNFQSLVVDLNVIGNINDISAFAISLNQRFPTSIETVVQLSRIPPTPTPTPTDSPDPSPTVVPLIPPPPGFTPIVAPVKDFSATINLVIYNYKGN